MQGMRSWLYKNEQHLNLNSKQLILLLDSVDKDSVAIEMSGVAPINFSLVGTVRLN